MKIRRTIYIILGSLLILLNILVDIVNPDKSPMAEDAGAYDIGYFVGSHILIVFGLLFLFWAYKLHKKIRTRPDDELEKNIDDIGKN
jgi:uncharacterized membrane protein